jgi:hypothetical protein
MKKRKNYWLYKLYINNKLVKIYKTKKGFDKKADFLIDNRIDYRFEIVANY